MWDKIKNEGRNKYENHNKLKRKRSKERDTEVRKNKRFTKKRRHSKEFKLKTNQVRAIKKSGNSGFLITLRL